MHIKKLLAAVLSAALMAGLLTTPSAAKTTPDYKTTSLTDHHGTSFTFPSAATGYGISFIWGDTEEPTDEITSRPLIVLKDDSTFTAVKNANTDQDSWDNLQCWNVSEDKLTLTYHVNHTFTSGSKVSDLYGRSQFSYMDDPFLVTLYTPKGQMVFLIREKDLDRITWSYPGPTADWSVPTQKTSTFQSHAVLTEAYVADLAYNQFTLTVTNDTDYNDSGVVALVLVSDIVTVTPLYYEVDPHSSTQIDATCVGHIGQIDNRLTLLAELPKYLSATIIHFTSVDDYRDFFSCIPVEANAQVNDYVNQNINIGSILVCDGTPGDTWLQTLGLQRKSPRPLSPDVSHDLCSTLDL